MCHNPLKLFCCHCYHCCVSVVVVVARVVVVAVFKKDSRVFQGRLKGVSRRIEVCFNGVVFKCICKKFISYLMEVSKVFLGSFNFKEGSTVFNED